MEQGIEPTILLSVIIVLIVIFVTLFIYMIIVVSKGRAATRKRLEAAFNFASVINQDGAKGFYYLNSSIVDAEGKPVEFSEEIGAYELLFSGFAFGSQIPQHCCQIAVENVQMKHDEYGRCFGHEPIQFFLRPANNMPDLWIIIEVYEKTVICEHPVMGKLEIPKEICAYAISGSTVRLTPFVKRTSSGYLLQYVRMA